MSITLKIKSPAPLSVSRRATAELRQFSCGKKNYSRIYSQGYLVIRIGCFWRLLSKNGGKTWSLMTHEKYNVESRR
ncbi:hypothetical protein [Cedecea davisae]|uniref:ParE family toxin-like protein n=1 Tax=Cedecea davisae TaxID=158484 RepID=UPI002432900E|nr:hypothetical protein [Cedecea davisae]